MRLLNTATYELHVFDDISYAPPYAILSHTWGNLNEEITFTDLRDAKKTFQEPSSEKLRGACLIAQSHELQWLWADTVCIDRSSSAELSEAVNSAYQWLQQSRVCFVYLNDFQSTEREHDSLKADLARCRWFQRSWTLQELIAPRNVQFFGRNWTHIGSKMTLTKPLADITRVDAAVLRDPGCLFDFSIGRRMSWAANRSARYEEDIAYSLVGLFAVSLQVLYGEKKKAFLKLQQEILKDTTDFTLLAWESKTNDAIRGLLAHSPSEFSHFSNPPYTGPLQMRGDIIATSAGFCVEEFFKTDKSGLGIILVLCNEQNPEDLSTCLGIRLRQWNNYHVRISGLVRNLPTQPVASTRKICILRDVDHTRSGIIHNDLARQQHRWGLPNEPLPSCSHKTVGFVHPSQLALEQISGAGFSNKGSVSINQYATLDMETWSAFGTAPTRSSTLFRSHDTTGSTKATNPETVTNSLYGSPERMDYAPTDEVENDACSSIHPDISSEYNGSEEDDMNIFNLLPSKSTELDPTFLSVKGELIEYSLKQFSQYASKAACSSKRVKERSLSSTSKRRKSDALNAHIEVDNTLNSDAEDDETVLVGYRKPKKDYFACPYYQSDSTKYQSCLNRESLRTIRDVKRHLWAEHRKPYFCLVCYSTFNTAQECNDHTRSRSCSSKGEQEIDGITENQMQQLAAKSNPEHSPGQQWFAVWDIVFPTKERPKQPYFSGNVENLVCLLREYWTKEGKGVIAEFLESKNMRNYGEMVNEERNLEALYLIVLHQIVDKVLTWFRESGSSSLAKSEASGDWEFANIFRRNIPGH